MLPVYLSIAIVICAAVYFSRISREGFTDVQKSYKLLQTRLKTDLKGYCELTNFVQQQMKKMFKDSGGEAQILQTYRDVYACRDELASSRPTCKINKLKVSGDFIPCSAYTLPDWTDQNTLAIALSVIPDDLANRIIVESQYYKQILGKLQEGLNVAKDPPGAPPDSPSSPSKNSSGERWGVEGFFGSCSAAEAQAKLEMMRKQSLMDGASSCTVRSLDSEIARINALLDSSSVKSALAGIRGILALMKQTEADIEAIKKKWGDDGPKKSYTKFQGGDRTAGLLFSMQQL